MWGVCVHAHLQRSDEGTNLLELQLQAVVSCSTQVPETRCRKPGSLEEQQALSAIEPSFQPPAVFLKILI